jgi:ATP-dependent Clp protease protease subunit
METIKRNGYQIKAKSTSAEILIYDDIGEGWLGGISSKAFLDDLNKVPKGIDTVNIRIHSEGGSVFEGHAIYNAIKRLDAKVLVDIDGLAASIASVIAMAGDEIRMAENGFMMIHDPWMVTAGTAEELRDAADQMDKVRDVLLKTYVKRTGGDEDTISAMMAEETWMNADEALEMGFIDTITDDLKMAAKVDHPDRYKRVPEPLAKVDEEPPPRSLKVANINTYLQQSLKAKNL